MMNLITIFVISVFLKISIPHVLILVDEKTEKYFTKSDGFETLRIEDESCGNLSIAADTLIFDTTSRAHESFVNFPVIYHRIDLSPRPIFELIEAYLEAKNIHNYVIVFEQVKELDEYLNYLLDLKVKPARKWHGTFGFTKKTVHNLMQLRPYPQSYIIVTNTKSASSFYQLLVDAKAMSFKHQWMFVIDEPTENNLYLPDIDLIQLTYPNFVNDLIVGSLAELQLTLLVRIAKDLTFSHNRSNFVWNVCNKNYSDAASIVEGFTNNTIHLERFLNAVFENELLKISKNGVISVRINGTLNGDGTVSESKTNAIVFQPQLSITRKVMRIGTTSAMPWSYQETDLKTGRRYWTGYCIVLVKKLAELLDFDYEFVSPAIGSFGRKYTNGSWDGTIGDLVKGNTEMIATALVMTAQRENDIDFVVPYFAESGLSIVIRKPYESTALFKFILVYKRETWIFVILSIAATVVLLWLVDSNSPVKRKKRPFTLKKSFWFCMASLTPLGGGRVPESISGRIVVATYWIFTAMIMATFTANLASFLTSERLRAPVQNLFQLGSQSRIKYTVVKDSSAHKYFINMKNAEDILHSSMDKTLLQVWDYPIREAYSEMLLAINETGPVETFAEALNRVDRSFASDFALIHDSSELEYELNRNCNLTKIGTSFGLRPLALAIRKGSDFHDRIMTKLVYLQDKTQFFEDVHKVYWNVTLRNLCLSKTAEEGIKLQNIGGLFIVTAIVLLISGVMLTSELTHFKLFRSPEKRQMQHRQQQQIPLPNIQISSTVGSESSRDVSAISQRSELPFVD